MALQAPAYRPYLLHLQIVALQTIVCSASQMHHALLVVFECIWVESRTAALSLMARIADHLLAIVSAPHRGLSWPAGCCCNTSLLIISFQSLPFAQTDVFGVLREFAKGDRPRVSYLRRVQIDLLNPLVGFLHDEGLFVSWLGQLLACFFQPQIRHFILLFSFNCRHQVNSYSFH